MKRVLLFVLVVILLAAVPALASDISSAQYLTKILVSNNTSGAITNAAVIFTCNTSSVIDSDLLSDNASDLVLQSDTGEDIVVMPGWGANPWVFFVESIGAGGQEWEFLYTKGVSSDMLAYFPGSTGMIVYDSPTLQLGGVFAITETFYFDSAQVGQIIFDKPNAITCNVTASEEITATIYGTSISVIATGVQSGLHIVKVEADGYNLYIYIDDELKDTEPL